MLTNSKRKGFFILCCFLLVVLTKSAFSQDINQINIANEYYTTGDVDKALYQYER